MDSLCGERIMAEEVGVDLMDTEQTSLQNLVVLVVVVPVHRGAVRPGGGWRRHARPTVGWSG